MKAAPDSGRPTPPIKRSFPPIVDTCARVLVLGTLPGEESLRRMEYYAHPRNLFWPIIFALFGESPASDYADRLTFVASHRIALWDVCEFAKREASADTSIRGERPNRIADLLEGHPLIRAIAFNGGGARRLYDRHFPRRVDLIYLALPSTSPAHARIGFAEKFARWKALRELLDEPDEGAAPRPAESAGLPLGP